MLKDLDLLRRPIKMRNLRSDRMVTENKFYWNLQMYEKLISFEQMVLSFLKIRIFFQVFSRLYNFLKKQIKFTLTNIHYSVTISE